MMVSLSGGTSLRFAALRLDSFSFKDITGPQIFGSLKMLRPEFSGYISQLGPEHNHPLRN
jgi:hypothetical protein